MTDAHIMFGLLCSLVVVPIASIVFLASLFRRRDRMNGLLALAVVAGFLVAGFIGWASVPAAWTASLWTTVDASMNAAKYGAAFEHTAERALMYFFFPAIAGALGTGVTVLGAMWVLPVPESAKPVA
jgi:hypothetical protein